MPGTVRRQPVLQLHRRSDIPAHHAGHRMQPRLALLPAGLWPLADLCTLIQNWNGRVTSDDTVYVLGDAFWKNEENSIRIMERLQGQKHLIQGNHDRVKGKLRPYWESIEQYAEVNDENRLVILSHYPILFYKNQHYGAVMLYGHVHNTREWSLVEKWKKEQWAMRIPSRLINVGCMMAYMNYTPRTLDELLDANPMPEIARDRKDGSAVESAE